jgi:dihydropteroate synthase
MQWVLPSKTIKLTRPHVMGILNVTPDSFSDGGLYTDPIKALDRAQEIQAEGADFLDIGAESTRPGAKAILPQEEWSRLAAALKLILPKVSLPISIDTRHGEVAERALEMGVDIINDISGGKDTRLLKVTAASQAGYILMHMRGVPGNMMDLAHYDHVLAEVEKEMGQAYREVQKAGISASRILRDPGFGFAKDPAQNFQLLHHLERLIQPGEAWMVGLSRKRMLRELVGEDPELLQAATVSACLLAYQKGARVFRVHEVAETVAVLQSYAVLDKAR